MHEECVETLCACLNGMHTSHRLLKYNTMYPLQHAAFSACTSYGMPRLVLAVPICDSNRYKLLAGYISTMFGNSKVCDLAYLHRWLVMKPAISSSYSSVCKL